MTYLHYHHLLCCLVYYFNYNERVLWTLSHLQNVCHSFLLDFGFHLQWATNFFITCPFFLYLLYLCFTHTYHKYYMHSSRFIYLYIYSNIISYIWVCLSILFDQTQSKSLPCFCFKCSTCCMRVFFIMSLSNFKYSISILYISVACITHINAYAVYLALFCLYVCFVVWT